MQTPKIFVFMHVGETDEYRAAEMLVRSIKASNGSGSQIVQVTDESSIEVPGIDLLFRRSNPAPEKIMRFRTSLFYELKLEGPAIYLDTDMLVINDLDTNLLLGHFEAALCTRVFDRDTTFNTNQMGLPLDHYRGETVGNVYPFIGCFTVTRNHAFWGACLSVYDELDENFSRWYGDQEALKIVSRSGVFPICSAPEDIYACLPEYVDLGKMPKVIHFKGPHRKAMMEGLFDEIFT